MARPFKPLQRRANGIYFVQVHVEGKRHQRSLETRDPRVATKRAAQAIQEIQDAASTRVETRWAADEPATVWEIPTKPDGSNDFDNAVEVQTTWGDLATSEDQIKTIDWRDLVAEAVRVRKRKTGEDFSDGWYDNQKFAIQRCPFSLAEATPVTIRSWIRSMEEEGLSPRSIEINNAILRSLINVSIKSGLLHDLEVNPFTRVDFSTDEVKHIHTATESDYRGLSSVVPTIATNQRLAILLQAYTGTRISEIKRRGAESFDLDAHTFTIWKDKNKRLSVKNKHSNRVLPLPSWLCDELRGFDFQWPSNTIINRKLKRVNEEMSSHSFRHGLIRINRDIGGPEDVIEAFVGHALDGMKSTYGDGYSVDRFREAIGPVWKQLDEWLRTAPTP